MGLAIQDGIEPRDAWLHSVTVWFSCSVQGTPGVQPVSYMGDVTGDPRCSSRVSPVRTSAAIGGTKLCSFCGLCASSQHLRRRVPCLENTSQIFITESKIRRREVCVNTDLIGDGLVWCPLWS